jgi:hypothetical protein
MQRARASAFRVAGDASVRAPATPAVQTVGGIDALLLLQGLEDATQRRRRAIQHGHSALDALGDLKLEILAGAFDGRTLARLRSLAASLREPSGDPALDIVLAEVALRVEVELAKLEQHAAGQGVERSV